MKKYISISICLTLFCFIISCNKTKTVGAKETYKIVGRIDPTRTTISTATLTKAEFTIVYNNLNSFNEAQSLLNGNITLAGYSGITGRDTLSFFSTQASGPNLSFITAANSSIGTTNTNLLFNYFNGPAATFNVTNYAFGNEVTAGLKDKRGFVRIGQFPSYVFILLDNVTKL